MLTRLFGRNRSAEAKPEMQISYEQQKEMAQNDDTKLRLELARREDARPEILYFLASDKSLEVRRAIALNPATPVQADAILAGDLDDAVRVDMARKISRLVPDMPPEEQAKIRELTIEMLENLASDQLPRVRAVVAEELKHTAKAPLQVIMQLAKDIEAIVAAPILEFSPLLSDADLKEIIAAGTAQEALTAIARRAELSEEVSDAVVASLDVPAVAALLTNKSAQIREETLDVIVDNAENIESWHEPLVVRPELSVRAMRRIATFVATSLIEILAQRNDLDPEFAEELGEAVRKRISQTTGDLHDDSEKRAEDLHRRGQLEDEVLVEALDAGQTEFVIKAISLLSGFNSASVRQIMESRNPQAVTAITWKAQLSMRTAMRFQAKLGHIPPQKILNARGGFDYPISEKEMDWCLDAYR